MTTISTTHRTGVAPLRKRALGRLALPAAVAVVVGLVVLSLNVGVYDLNEETFGSEMLWITRVTRTAALVLAGVAMAMCGLIMQMLTQNKFVEPSVVGTSEWAGLGLLVSFLVMPFASLTSRIIVASLFAIGGTMLFMAILRRVVLRTSLIVPLIGIMLSAVVGAFSTYVAMSTERRSEERRVGNGSGWGGRVNESKINGRSMV